MKTYGIKVSSRFGAHIETHYIDSDSYMNAYYELRKTFPNSEIFTLISVTCLVCQ